MNPQLKDKFNPFFSHISLCQKQSPKGALQKSCSFKFCKIYKKTPVPDHIFNIKTNSCTDVFLSNLKKFLEDLFYRTAQVDCFYFACYGISVTLLCLLLLIKSFLVGIWFFVVKSKFLKKYINRRGIYNPAKHLWWSFLLIFAKMPYYKYLTEFSIRLWLKYLWKHFNVISTLSVGWYHVATSNNVKSTLKQRWVRQR